MGRFDKLENTTTVCCQRPRGSIEGVAHGRQVALSPRLIQSGGSRIYLGIVYTRADTARTKRDVVYSVVGGGSRATPGRSRIELGAVIQHGHQMTKPSPKGKRLIPLVEIPSHNSGEALHPSPAPISLEKSRPQVAVYFRSFFRGGT